MMPKKIELRGGSVSTAKRCLALAGYRAECFDRLMMDWMVAVVPGRSEMLTLLDGTTRGTCDASIVILANAVVVVRPLVAAGELVACLLGADLPVEIL